MTLVSIVMTIIWTETITYFEYFHHTDSGMIQGGVLLGTALTTSCFVVNLVEVWQTCFIADSRCNKSPTMLLPIS